MINGCENCIHAAKEGIEEPCRDCISSLDNAYFKPKHLLRKLQHEHKAWQAYNFGTQEASDIFIGIVEEVGELAHSHLKQKQGIRSNEDHEAKSKDAIGDMCIFLANYCNLRGYDLHEIIETTWSEVSKRDWIKYPNTGRPEE